MIIADAQKRIADAMKEQTELEPSVKEYYSAYIALKDKLDSTKKKILEDSDLLEAASNVLNGIKTGKGFQVLRGESHLDMKEKEKRKYNGVRYKWMEMGIETLKKFNKFVTVDELWLAVVQEYKIPKGKERNKSRWSCINTIWKRSEKMYQFQGKIGLVEWTEEISKYWRNAV